MSCLWVCNGWQATPSLQDPHRKDLGAISPNQTWHLLRAGSYSPCIPPWIWQAKNLSLCLMTLPAVQSAKNAPCFLRVGWCPPPMASKAWWWGEHELGLLGHLLVGLVGEEPTCHHLIILGNGLSCWAGSFTASSNLLPLQKHFSDINALPI